MKRSKIIGILMTLVLAAVAAEARIITYERDIDYAGRINYDRYLDVEIWTDDEEYYEGDKIKVSFRANEDCFVAIYNIDTRGRVNLLFPENPGGDNRIQGDRIYSIPGSYDDFELTVQGPPGTEFVRIVASEHPFEIPGWFDEDELVCDDDTYEFIDYIDATYFGGERDLNRSFDLTSFEVEQWHDYYFRPVYVERYHHRPYWDWGLYGGVYIDYPFGATIYIDGVYWGIAPLFIPRIYYGWHFVTIYDHYGYCWEDRIEVVKTRSVIINETRVKTSPNIKSRFKEVRTRGYLAPEKNGYPNYKQDIKIKSSQPSISKTAKILNNNIVDDNSWKNNRTTKGSSSIKNDDRQNDSRKSGSAYEARQKAEKRSYKSSYESKSDNKNRGNDSSPNYKSDTSRKSDRTVEKTTVKEAGGNKGSQSLPTGSGKRDSGSSYKEKSSSKSSSSAGKQSSSGKSSSNGDSGKKSADKTSTGTGKKGR